jgi:hypothetical protein
MLSPMSRAIALLFSLTVVGPTALFAQGPTVVLAPPPVLQAFDIAAGTVQSLAVPAAPAPTMQIAVSMAGQVETLELWPFDVRAPGFQLWSRDANGLTPLPTPANQTCRGTIAGDLDSEVAATLTGTGLIAWMRRGNGDIWVVQPLLGTVPGAGAAAHVVFRSADSALPAANCSVIAPPVTVPAGGGGEDVLYQAQVAIEADYPLFVARGSSVVNTQNDVTSVMNAIDLIYRNNVQIQLQLGQLIVNSSPDPYTTSAANSLLGQFQSYWNFNYGAVSRDMAHLFSGRNIGQTSGGTIGIAFVGVVCSLGAAYGLSQTTWTTNFAGRVAVTAHEMGHNFDATHCDGQAGCAIMCSGLGGCPGGISSFSTFERNQINAFRQSINCLTTIATPPTITSLSPAQVETVGPALVTVNGVGLVGVNQITVGSASVTTGIQIVNDNQLRFTPPAGQTLGGKPVSVTNSAATSNSLTVTYIASDPARLLVPTALLGGQTLTWTLGGWPNDAAYLGIDFASATQPLFGENVLIGFIPLWIGTLDARGMATFAIPVPAGLLGGITVYSQMIDQNPGAPISLRSVSNVRSTLIVN